MDSPDSLIDVQAEKKIFDAQENKVRGRAGNHDHACCAKRIAQRMPSFHSAALFVCATYMHVTCQLLPRTSALQLVSHNRAPHGCWRSYLLPKFQLLCLPSCAPTSQEYLAIEGLEAFRKATVDLLLGADHPAIKEVSSRGHRA